jgi:SAM-dependent MidA family methyltransferase
MAHAPQPRTAEESARSTLIVDRLRAMADETGFIPFDRFMEVALYSADVGFYFRPRSPLGRAGDFYTAAHVHSLFGASLANRIREIRKRFPARAPFSIVEMGPGDGTLAADVLAALGDEALELDYVLVERSPARAREAEARIHAVAPRTPVGRADSIGSLGPFQGVVVANEFLDAQPARRLRWDGTAWRELGVRVQNGRVEAAEAATARALSGPPLPTPLPDEPTLIVEVSPLAEGFVRELSDHLTRGLAVLIDYGFEESELLRGHPRGTLAAVRDHRRQDDPLESPGTADLSTFVNFSRIRSVARASGLVEVSYRSQSEALGEWGFPALLDGAVRSAGSSEAEVRVRLAAKNLLFGFENFRVLELSAPPGPDVPRPVT